MSLSEQDRHELLRAWPWPKEAATTELGFADVAAAVEQIVARHVAAALTEAADAIEAEVKQDGFLMTANHRRGFSDAAAIVRDLAAKHAP